MDTILEINLRRKCMEKILDGKKKIFFGKNFFCLIIKRKKKQDFWYHSRNFWIFFDRVINFFKKI